MKPTRTWILIADGAQARFLLNDGPGHGVKALNEFNFEGSHKPSREINADRPGRSFDSMGDGRHAMEPVTDANRDQSRKFAAMLIDVLAEQFEKNSFDKLVIVAAPATLGDLRAKMPHSLKSIVTGEIAKDLTHIPVGKIAPYLSEVLAV